MTRSRAATEIAWPASTVRSASTSRWASTTIMSPILRVRTACTPTTPGVPASVASMATTSSWSAALSIRSLRADHVNVAPMRPTRKPTMAAAMGSNSGYPSRLPTMPRLTTSDDAASERACHALAISMLERTRLPTASM